METRKTRKSNKTLGVMLAGIIILAVIIFWLPTEQFAEQNDDVAQTTLVKEGDMAPDFEVEMFDGEKISLQTLRGNVVLVTFWATWCPPCRQEMSVVKEQLIDRFAGRNFVFLPISRGEKREAVAAFREKMGYDFAMGLDTDRSIYDRFAQNYIPRNFLIDAEGRIVEWHVGFNEDEFETMITRIDSMLAPVKAQAATKAEAQDK